MKRRFANGYSGFTFVEVLFVVLLVALAGAMVSSLFSHGLKGTLKGMDRADTVQAFSQLMGCMRSDVANAVEISPPPVELYPSDTNVPVDIDGQSRLEVKLIDGTTVSYSFDKADGSKQSLIERIEKGPLGKVISTRTFGTDRTELFEVRHIIKKINLGGVERQVNHILILLIFDSNDPRFPNQKLKFEHVLVVNRLPESNWNNSNRIYTPLGP